MFCVLPVLILMPVHGTLALAGASELGHPMMHYRDWNRSLGTGCGTEPRCSVTEPPARPPGGDRGPLWLDKEPWGPLPWGKGRVTQGSAGAARGGHKTHTPIPWPLLLGHSRCSRQQEVPLGRCFSQSRAGAHSGSSHRAPQCS